MKFGLVVSVERAQNFRTIQVTTSCMVINAPGIDTSGMDSLVIDI